MHSVLLRTFLAAVVVGTLAACSSIPKMDDVIKDRQIEYKTSRSLPPLEIPPDLSSASVGDRMEVPGTAGAEGSATYSSYASGKPGVAAAGTTVLPNPAGIKVVHDKDKRWLVLDGAPSLWWDRVRDFWLENGMVLTIENPSIGIMETDWAENRADIPQGFIRSMLGKLVDSVYSTATRDKFRVRFERGAKPGTTEIYLTHRGAEEVVQGDTTVWQPRPSDPELEAEMLNRLMVYLGVKKEKARQMLAQAQSHAPRASLTRTAGGEVSLSLVDEYSRAWRRTGLALDRVGFTVQDRDRSRGLYFVRYVDPLKDNEKKGFLSKLKFWGSDKDKDEGKNEYLIHLVAQGGATRLEVLDKKGQRDNSPTAGRILSLLEEQLK